MKNLDRFPRPLPPPPPPPSQIEDGKMARFALWFILDLEGIGAAVPIYSAKIAILAILAKTTS